MHAAVSTLGEEWHTLQMEKSCVVHTYHVAKAAAPHLLTLW